MQVVCEATQCQAVGVQIAAFEALVKVMSLYYDYMQPYMERALFAVRIKKKKFYSFFFLLLFLPRFFCFFFSFSSPFLLGLLLSPFLFYLLFEIASEHIKPTIGCVSFLRSKGINGDYANIRVSATSKCSEFYFLGLTFLWSFLISSLRQSFFVLFRFHLLYSLFLSNPFFFLSSFLPSFSFR